jgi:hypothetical protein
MAKMTRQHFRFIAEVIKEMPTHAPNLRANKLAVANRFAKELKRTNSAFKDGTFLEACGVTFENAIAECK